MGEGMKFESRSNDWERIQSDDEQADEGHHHPEQLTVAAFIQKASHGPGNSKAYACRAGYRFPTAYGAAALKNERSRTLRTVRACLVLRVVWARSRCDGLGVAIDLDCA